MYMFVIKWSSCVKYVVHRHVLHAGKVTVSVVKIILENQRYFRLPDAFECTGQRCAS
jgi:hypothetical protein